MSEPEVGASTATASVGPVRSPDAKPLDLGALLARGAVAGSAGGLVFLLITMFYVVDKGLPAVAPLLDISTIFHASAMPVISPENMFVGLVVHLTLSIAFGVGFALLTPMLPSRRMLLIAGPAYGLLLYLVNFQILGRTAFPWFTNPHGPNQSFEIADHALFGLLLVPFFLNLAVPIWRQPSRSRTAA